ncbi:MAG TPA: transketolase [candidate division Zixibacteria bacterium]|nr:transketolase [candidate division Zixibacteria bacterium]
MPLTDSKAKNTLRDYTIDELKERANYMRGLNLLSLCSAGSGHSGGTLGIMDVCAALYLKVARHDPKDPNWSDRDRIIWSAGHKAPALYTSLAVSGYFEETELMKLRMLGSPFQGHPHRKDLAGVEISSGSLGQGFSVGVGVALAARLDKKDYRVFIISSDGEQQEGSMWEAAMSAAHYHLDNLVLILDRNHLQIDGRTEDVMRIDPINDKYTAFGWHVIDVDGHDLADIVKKLDWARNHNDTGKPVALICHTVKGKGVSFMENVVGWHGKSPNREELDKALVELDLTGTFNADEWLAHGVAYQKKVEARLSENLPKFSENCWWNAGEKMQVKMDPTRKGFGRALDKYGDDERVVCIGADISGSITISDFNAKHPERNDRFISVGIAEQNATTVAAGLAKEGKIPVFGTYGVFSSARNLDQVRVSCCYGDFNVLIVGAHGGISVGPDGATHQELESLFQMTGLPNMHVGVPCDSIETEKMTKAMLFDIVGPKYLRFAREATPIVSDWDTPFKFGKANIYRFRKEAESFVDAFEVKLASDYKSENEQLTIIACGPATPEALRAAWILRKDFGLETRVVNMHTVKPLDREAILQAAAETGAIITAEEHQKGGLGNLVAATLCLNPNKKVIPFEMVGVSDRFGESGKPWQLVKEFGLAAEHIADKAKKLLKL